MIPLNFDNSLSTKKMAELINYSASAANVGGYCRSGYTHFGKRPPSENQHGIKNDVDSIGNP